jgi:hypothetical protein
LLTRRLILEQKDQLASRSSQRRARSAAPARTSACFAASQSLRTVLQSGHETPGVCEPSSILHQGRTWSDLLFTMSNSTRLPGEPAGRLILITSGRAPRVAASDPLGFRKRSIFADGSADNFGRKQFWPQESCAGDFTPEILRRRFCAGA